MWRHCAGIFIHFFAQENTMRIFFEENYKLKDYEIYSRAIRSGCGLTPRSGPVG